MSRLEKISKPFRDSLLAKDTYNINDQYNAGNIGGDTKTGLLGDKIDVSLEKKLIAKNKYNSSNQYNASNA